MKDFRHLFEAELKDIYCAEKQVVEILPEMIRAARNPKLKEVFEEHLMETKGQLERLEKIAQEVGVDFAEAESVAMKGLLKECQRILKMNYLDQVLDAALISMAQRIEHYEMAVYGVLRSFAKHMRLKDIEMLLAESEREDAHTDRKLREIAEGSFFGGGVNGEACKRRSS